MPTLVEKDTSNTYVASGNEVENPSRRTRSFKVFEDFDPATGRMIHRVGGQVGPIHFKENFWDEAEEYKEIDLTIRAGLGCDYEVSDNGYQVLVWNNRDKISYVARFLRAGHWLELAPISLYWENDLGEQEIISLPLEGIVPTIDNESYTITWPDTFGKGLDYSYNISPDRFFKTLILREEDSLPKATIDTSGLRLVLELAWGWSTGSTPTAFEATVAPQELLEEVLAVDYKLAQKERISSTFSYQFKRPILLEEETKDAFWIHEPRAWDSSVESPLEIPIEWHLSQVGNTWRAYFSVEQRALEDARYPVYVDTDIGEKQVGASTDDGRNAGGTYPGDGNLTLIEISGRLGASTTSFYIRGFRFLTVPIPNAATITAASISVKSKGGGPQTTQCDVDIYAEDADGAATFASTSHEPYDAYLAKTTALVNWPIGTATWTENTFYPSVDISSVIQEIVDRAGWASNNNLVLGMTNKAVVLPGANQYRTIGQWDNTGNADGAKFNASYTTGVAYDETGKGQTLLIGQSKNVTATRRNPDKNQILLVNQSQSGSAQFSDVDKSQILLISQSKIDALAMNELTKGQIVLLVQDSEDSTLLNELSKLQNLLIGQSRADTANSNELAKSQVLLINQGKSDILAGVELNSAQNILIGQSQADIASNNELGKSQVVLITQSKSDTIAGVELGKAQSILLSQSLLEHLILGELNKSQVILLTQSEVDELTAGGNFQYDETGKAQVLLISQLAADSYLCVELNRAQVLQIGQELIDSINVLPRGWPPFVALDVPTSILNTRLDPPYYENPLPNHPSLRNPIPNSMNPSRKPPSR